MNIRESAPLRGDAGGLGGGTKDPGSKFYQGTLSTDPWNLLWGGEGGSNHSALEDVEEER